MASLYGVLGGDNPGQLDPSSSPSAPPPGAGAVQPIANMQTPQSGQNRPAGGAGRRRITQRISLGDAAAKVANAPIPANAGVSANHITLPGMVGAASEAPTAPSFSGAVDVPVSVILSSLPPEVLAQDINVLLADPQAQATAPLPLDSILMMLPSGKVEFSIREIAGYIPANFIHPPEMLGPAADNLLRLPLSELVTRVPPDCLSIRPDQKTVDPTVKGMDEPFTQEMIEKLARQNEAAAAEAAVQDPAVAQAPADPLAAPPAAPEAPAFDAPSPPIPDENPAEAAPPPIDLPPAPPLLSQEEGSPLSFDAPAPPAFTEAPALEVPEAPADPAAPSFDMADVPPLNFDPSAPAGEGDLQPPPMPSLDAPAAAEAPPIPPAPTAPGLDLATEPGIAQEAPTIAFNPSELLNMSAEEAAPPPPIQPSDLSISADAPPPLPPAAPAFPPPAEESAPEPEAPSAPPLAPTSITPRVHPPAHLSPEMASTRPMGAPAPAFPPPAPPEPPKSEELEMAPPPPAPDFGMDAPESPAAEATEEIIPPAMPQIPSFAEEANVIEAPVPAAAADDEDFDFSFTDSDEFKNFLEEAEADLAGGDAAAVPKATAAEGEPEAPTSGAPEVTTQDLSNIFNKALGNIGEGGSSAPDTSAFSALPEEAPQDAFSGEPAAPEISEMPPAPATPPAPALPDLSSDLSGSGASSKDSTQAFKTDSEPASREAGDSPILPPGLAVPSEPIAPDAGAEVSSEPDDKKAIPNEVNKLIGVSPDQDIRIQDITSIIRRWPGVDGCLISSQQGLAISSDMDDKALVSSISAFAPKILSGVAELAKHLSSDETQELHLPAQNTSLSMFASGGLIMVVLHGDSGLPETYSAVIRKVLFTLSKSFNLGK